METTHVVLFGPDKDAVLESTEEIRSLCEQKGVEYQGPHTYEVIEDWTPDEDDEPPYVINGHEMDDAETERLLHQPIFTRKFQLYRYASDDVVRKITLSEYPEDVFLTIEVDQTEFQGWNRGYAPHSYDPATNYKTDP